MSAPTISIELVSRLPRRCGDCQLCCKLMPVAEIGKKAGVRCKHQRVGKGCQVYDRAGMPASCKLWSCAWLTGAETGARPDRSHVVVDILPDFVTLENNESGERQTVPVVQVWIDPSYPDAHRDPAIRAYLAKRGEDGVAAL